MISRSERMAQFVESAGWRDADITPLAGDASNRRYLRLKRGPMRSVLMDAPPEHGEDVRPFRAVTRWLRHAGFSAPEILSADEEHGFLLLEDLGDELYSRHLAFHPMQERDLYSAAVDALVALASCAAEDFDPDWNLGTYDLAVYEREALLIVDWWLDEGRAGQAADLAGLLGEAVSDIDTMQHIMVLRDYHAENLVWLPERRGVARVGLLDYQDALAGHCAYDLVSLLEDARRDTSEELRRAMIAAYLDRRPDIDREAFHYAYAFLGAQRNLKIIGIFSRLALRDGKPRYLDLIPRVWDHLMRDLAHPSLSRLSTWVSAHIPPPERSELDRIGARSMS